MARHQSCLRHLCIVTGLLLVAGVASAAPVINIFPSIGPDFDVAATFGEYSANALFALEHGLSSRGDASAPSYYEQASSVTSRDVVSTYNTFESWRGQTPPPAGYEGQYGNMLYWGVSINGGGERFSLSNVIFTGAFFGDPYSTTLGHIDFGLRAIGISSGADHILGTADDIRYDTAASGDSSTLVDVLYFSGLGEAFLVNDPAKLPYYLEQIRNVDYPYARGAYMVNTVSGPTINDDEIVMSDAVPEPATFGFVGIGLLAIAYAGRRWKR